MTQDQVMGLLRQFLPIVGTLLVAFKVVPSNDAAQTLTADILAAVGAVMALGSFGWTLIANSKSSIIKSASAMPEVNSDKLAAAITDPELKQAAKDGATSQVAS
jgi:hypothetical protein